MVENTTIKARTEYDVEAEERERKYGKNYKWLALSNTTLGAFMIGLDGSILLIALPAIFKGLGVNPLVPANISLLLWLLLGYTVVIAALTAALGRISDMIGRVKIYNAGFLIFAIGSFLLFLSSYMIHGVEGALAMIIFRVIQAVGGAFMLSNYSAIIVDAFPHKERGTGLGISQVGFVGGSLIGLVLGGILASIDWHLIFTINVPIGIIGTVWAYMSLHEVATIKKNQKVDLPGIVTFAASLVLLLISLTYGLLPYGNSSMGWGSPFVELGILAGIATMIGFIFIELRSRDPMFKLELFKIREFGAGALSQFLSNMSRSGLQFILIIWLQGVWLPMHGVSFENTPLAAGIDMIPLILGFVLAGPLAGRLSDKHGSKYLATGGMLIAAIGFLLMFTIPLNFNYIEFAAIIFIIGVEGGMFNSPNMNSIMNSVPPENRGSVGGMLSSIFNVAFMFSLILFFSMLIIGFSHSLPHALYTGLLSENVSSSAALNASRIPPTAALFAAFLGYNPMKTLLPQSVLSSMPAANLNAIIGNEFFPDLISKPLQDGLGIVFISGAIMAFIAAIASSLRGKVITYEGRKIEEK